MSRLPGHLGIEEQLGGFREVGLDALEVDDPDASEDRLVEASPHLVARVEVELVGIAEQLHPAADLRDAFSEVVLDAAELDLTARFCSSISRIRALAFAATNPPSATRSMRLSAFVESWASRVLSCWRSSFWTCFWSASTLSIQFPTQVMKSGDKRTVR